MAKMNCPVCGKEAASIEKSDDYSSWYCGSCNAFFWDYKGEYLTGSSRLKEADG